MTETVNFINSPGLEKFSGLIVSTFASSLSAISSRSVNLSLSEMVKCDADTLFAAYENETLVVSKEDNGDYETGLLFRTRDITKLADFMLAGDGESKDEIDDDTKDAVQELTSQLLSSLNVPFEEAFTNKFSFKSEDVIKNTSSALFQCAEYYCIDLAGDVDGAELNFRFVCDTNIEGKLGGQDDGNLINDGSIEALLGNAGISFDDEPPAESSGNTPKNLDLLLDIDIPISVRMGSAKLFLKDILGLGPGNIVELEQNADDPIELAINDKVIARGEVVIVDGYFGFRIKEIVSKAERIRKLKD